MRTFEITTGKTKKLWTIERQGKQVTITSGRAKPKTTTWKTAREAEASCNELIQEKIAEGYVETTDVQPLPPLQFALEQALIDEPDNLANHAAYADFLIEQNNPRGEFIQVQLALEDPGRSAKEREQLQKREQAILKKHGIEWLGNLAEHLFDVQTDRRYYQSGGEKQNFRFARGWLDTLDIRTLTVRFARALATAPQSRLLRQLLIEQTAYHGDPDEQEPYVPGPDIPAQTEYPALYPLLRSSNLGNVRIFQFGERYEDSRWGGPGCHTSGEAVVDLIRTMPRLEELYLMAHGLDTNNLFSLPTLTNLRILEVDHEHHYPLERLAANSALARLTSLTLHPHGLDDEEAYIRLPGLRAILHSPHLGNLTRLALRVTDVGDPGCAEVVRSGILKRLKVLELTHGCISDAGATVLAKCPDCKNLELLNLSYNALTEKGIQELKNAGITLRADEQHSASEIEDRMYLYEGDPE